jgi:cytochrome c biogenesis protein CcmG/thiol:disulfide interchange protein DsbE
MRLASSALCLLSIVSSAACSRSERTQRKLSSLVAAASSTAIGPRAELMSSADSATGLEPLLAFPVVDGPTLLQKIRDSGQRGVVVNIWASWCDPCREELPMLARVAPQLAARGVPIWLVSVDSAADLPAAKALLDSLHIGLPSFGAAPPLQDFKVALNPDWPGMIPVSFLFDASGTLRHFWRGEVYEDELVPLVRDFVAGKPIDSVSKFGLAPGATEGPPR